MTFEGLLTNLLRHYVVDLTSTVLGYGGLWYHWSADTDDS